MLDSMQVTDDVHSPYLLPSLQVTCTHKKASPDSGLHSFTKANRRTAAVGISSLGPLNSWVHNSHFLCPRLDSWLSHTLLGLLYPTKEQRRDITQHAQKKNCTEGRFWHTGNQGQGYKSRIHPWWAGGKWGEDVWSIGQGSTDWSCLLPSCPLSNLISLNILKITGLSDWVCSPVWWRAEWRRTGPPCWRDHLPGQTDEVMWSIPQGNWQCGQRSKSC